MYLKEQYEIALDLGLEHPNGDERLRSELKAEQPTFSPSYIV